MKRESLEQIRGLLLSDKFTCKGNEIPGVLNILAEINNEVGTSLKPVTEPDATDADPNDKAK